MITGAKIIVNTLEQYGVDYIFGMPGSQNLELVDSLVDSHIKNILVTSELSASFMANGYACATGKAGVCLSIPGPGLTYMITGIAEAFVDSFPMVVIVSAVEESDNFYHMHQIDQSRILSPMVKEFIRIHRCEEISDRFHSAFLSAQSGEPGPVIVEVPTYLLREKATYRPIDQKTVIEKPNADGERIQRISELIKSAECCGIYAGRGALSASDMIKEMAERFSMPVATTISGKGVIAEDHPLAVGFGFSPAGTPLAEEIFDKCDMVLALGCKFSEMSTGKWTMRVPNKLVHIDRNRDVFNRNYPAFITLCEDVSIALSNILKSLSGYRKDKNYKLVDEIEQKKSGQLKSASTQTVSKGIHPSRLIYQLRRTIERDTIVVTDCGNHQLWAVTDLPIFAPGTFITPADYLAMGFGIPAAVGASFGCPDRDVVCLCGDGGFLMTGFELLTAKKEKSRLKVIIFNDGALGLIKGTQTRVYGRSSTVDICQLNYRHYSQALGIGYVDIQTTQELEDGLKEMMDRQGVVLVNVKVEYDQWTRYQMGMAKASWHKMPLRNKIGVLGRRAGRVLKSLTKEGE